MDAVIPPKTNRKKQLSFDRYLYRYRHLVENRFLDFKRWRGIVTRYAKKLASFAAAIEIRIITMCLKILWLHYLEKSQKAETWCVSAFLGLFCKGFSILVDYCKQC